MTADVRGFRILRQMNKTHFRMQGYTITVFLDSLVILFISRHNVNTRI